MLYACHGGIHRVRRRRPAAGRALVLLPGRVLQLLARRRGAIAQSIKVLTTWYKENRWDAKQLVGSGGMPSSHSATVTALAVAVGLQEGFASSLFATAAVFASVVMYDAFGVRLHAGKQAEVLNQIVYELPSEHPLAETRPLRELLGHTPPQVFAGGVLGFAVATFTAMIAGLGS